MDRSGPGRAEQELEEIREWMRNFEVELKKRCFGTEALQQARGKWWMTTSMEE